MIKYILTRCVVALVTLVLLISIIFVLVRQLPGDPFLSEQTPVAIRDMMRQYYGLDRPLFEQWLTYMGKLVQGDFGVSLKYRGRTINSTIAQTFPYSASLGLRALILAVGIGLVLGTAAAQKSGGVLSVVCIVVAILGVSVPDFVIGSLGKLVFALNLRWFPPISSRWSTWRQMALPVFALSLYTIALLTRLTRSSMMEVLNQDYILTAKAKGLSTLQIIWRHQIRNSILPVITVMGPIVARLLTGTFVIESIYAVPGMGKFYVQSINDLDYTMVLGMAAFYGVFLVTANLVVDILYGIVDPRIKLAENKYQYSEEEEGEIQHEPYGMEHAG